MKKAEVSLKFASIKVALVLIVTLTLSMLSADCGWALSYEAEVLADNPTAYYRLGGDASNSHGSGEDGVASVESVLGMRVHSLTETRQPTSAVRTPTFRLPTATRHWTLKPVRPLPLSIG